MKERVKVFTFVSGHGETRQDASGIYLAAPQNQALFLRAEALAEKLNKKGLRVVILNACQTGAFLQNKHWSSLPSALMKTGIPAVIWVPVYGAAIFALSYNLLLGQTGLLSFGHGAFYAAGAYALGGWNVFTRGGRVDVVLKILRERWATMPSVLLNNTLQEDWKVQPDSGSQWSHCAVVPLYFLFMSVAGLTPLSPGFKRVEIRPQPRDVRQHLVLACAG